MTNEKNGKGEGAKGKTDPTPKGGNKVDPPPKTEPPKGELTSEEKSSAPGAAVAVAQLPQVRLKKAIAKYSGESRGIGLEAWLTQVEAMCQAMGINDDQGKITAAKDEIDYTSGEAKVIVKKTFRSWEHFKEVFRGWACASPPTLHLDIERFFGCRWKPKQSFLAYTEELLDLFDRMCSKPQSKPEYVEVYYFYMVGTIIAQLPEFLKKEYLLKKVDIKSRVDFDDWTLEINMKLNFGQQSKYQQQGKYQPVLMVEDRSGAQRGSKPKQQPARKEGKQGKPNRWEELNNRCGRCLDRSHFRADCTARDPKCGFCEGVHDFFECPTRKSKRPWKNNQKNHFLG